MASNWIKMRADLFTHPKVVRMMSALKADALRTVGGLMSVWCLFDAHSVDGSLDGYTPEILDTHLHWDGFSTAMIAIGWLVDTGESLVLPEFETHNGLSAKRRAQDADRKKEVRKESASEADKKRTRIEKNRIDINHSADDKSPACPHQEIIDLYHELLPMGTRVREWTDERQKSLRARWRSNPKYQCLEYWRGLFEYIAQSKFLTSQVPPGNNHKQFVISLDWIVTASKFTNIIEGKYHEEAAA
jgi:hypothetical protein